MQARASKTIAAGKFISYSNNSELEKYLGCPLQAALNSHIILQRNRKWAKPLNSYLIYKKTKFSQLFLLNQSSQRGYSSMGSTHTQQRPDPNLFPSLCLMQGWLWTILSFPFLTNLAFLVKQEFYGTKLGFYNISFAILALFQWNQMEVIVMNWGNRQPPPWALQPCLIPIVSLVHLAVFHAV